MPRETPQTSIEPRFLEEQLFCRTNMKKKLEQSEQRVNELEQQNSALRQQLLALEQTHAHYVESYDAIACELEALRNKAGAKKILMQSILDHAPIGIWMLGIDEKIKFINLTFCNSVGITEQQFTAAGHYSDLLPPAASLNCMQSDRECLAQDAVHISTENLTFVDGQEHLIEISKTKVYDKLGNVLGLIGLAADITERNRLESSFKQTQSQLRELADHVEAWREEERKHIAREVHDELGQILTAFRMDVAWLDMLFGEQIPELHKKTQDMATLLDMAVSSVHRIVSNLRPAVLDIGLVPALDWLCEQFSARTGNEYVLHVRNDCINTNEKSIVALF
jgi:PAS domain S-box-containing protein